ncbi:MAG TPA: hypothetical protein VFC89_05135 [Oscillospiraceae bacterium]|nr:hypothetical protein [Oscillospiraceae bacterium]
MCGQFIGHKEESHVGVATEYTNVEELLAYSYLLVKVIFSQAEFINQYVSLAKVGKISAEHGSVPTAKRPKMIGVNEDVKVGEAYMVFQQFDSDRDSLLLAARHGAVVDSSDGVCWNEVSFYSKREAEI